MARATLVAILFVFSALVVSAQESTITFPVAELGGCTSKNECRAYCDDLGHINECVAFAESHGLMSAREAAQARKFAQAGGTGPGGCTSKESCEAYCEDASHMRQCLQFAKDSGVMGEHELEEAEKVAAYLESGGAMPGGCSGERQCRAYCEEGEHMEECAEFAIKAGFMSQKEAEIFRKTGGKGPGGCSGKQCETFCKDEANREQCITFALEHDLMSEEDKARMQEGMKKAQEALGKAPPEVLSCITEALGSDAVAKVQRGEGFASPKLGEVLPACFKQVMADGPKGPFGPGSAATDCMRKLFGDDYEEKMRSGELDPGARDGEIRACMQESQGEGYLNDSGQWERPERGEPPQGDDGAGRPEMRPTQTSDSDTSEEAYRAQYKGQYKAQYQEQFDVRRKEMETEMRAEIEKQMRSGEFDRSKLPADFKPEGAFPPPESFNRPPGGGSYAPPHQGRGQDVPQIQERSEPTSLISPLLANVLSALQYFFGVR